MTGTAVDKFMAAFRNGALHITMSVVIHFIDPVNLRRLVEKLPFSEGEMSVRRVVHPE